MKKILTTATFMVASALYSFAGISVSSPVSGTSVGSPVRFVASATSTTSAPITAMRVYVDGSSKHTAYSNKIDTSISLSSGTRQVTIMAWDANGQSQKTSYSINVGSTSTATSSGGLTVSSPANGATVSSPTRFVAYGSFVAMKIYVDSQEKYHTNSGKIDTSLSLAGGKRYVTIQAWTSSGSVSKVNLTINVSTSSADTGSSTTVEASTFWNIDQMTGWDSCDKCAGIGGDGPSTPYSMTIGRSSPSLDGKSTEFWLGGDTPYSQALWWKQLGPRDEARNFVYDLYYYIKNPAASQALEFDVNQSVNGKKYIFGTECNLKETKTWRIWDNINQKWINSGVGCAVPAAYTWVHVVWEFQRTSGGNVKYIAVTVNGKKSYINREFAPRSVSARELNVAFQMDGDYKQTDYSVWLDKVTLRYW